MALTFTRASSARYTDANSVIQVAATDVLRDAHYVGAIRTTRLEPAATNLCFNSQQIDNTLSPGAWAASAATRTYDAAIAPDGTLTADRIVGAAGGSAVYAVLTVTANTQYTFSWYAKNNGGAAVQYSIYNVTGAADIIAPTSYIATLADGHWHRITATFTTPVGCTQIQCYPHRTTGGASDFYVWGHQLELGAVATSYIPTTSTTATRAADILSLDFQGTAEAMTVFADLYECSRSGVAGRSFFHIGNTAAGAPYFEMAEKLGALTGSFNTRLHNGTTSTISADNAAATYTETQHVETRVILNTSGTHGVAVSTDGAAESSPAMATSPGALVTWSATTRLSLSGYGSVVGAGMSIAGLAVAQGIQDRTTMRSMLAPISSAITGTGTLAAVPTTSGSGAEKFTATGALRGSPTSSATGAETFTGTGTLASSGTTAGTGTSATTPITGTGALKASPTSTGTGTRGVTYYVSNVGLDTNSGLSTSLPWQTIAKVSATTFAAGDTILFNRGDTWNELLTIPSSGALGNRTTFGAYGTGARPIIQAADPVTGWVLDTAVAGGDRYKKVTLGFGLTPIYLWSSDNAADVHHLQVRAASLAACTALGGWFHDSAADTTYLVVATGTTPTTGGAVVHAGRRTNCIKASNGKNHIALQGLNLRFTNTTNTSEGMVSAQSLTFAFDNWAIDDLVCQWGSCGIFLKSTTNTPWAANYAISVTNTEIKYCLAHGMALTFYYGAVVANVNIHDCGRQGMGVLLRNSTIDGCRFDRNGNASDKWGAQRTTVQAYDSGCYNVGQPAPLAIAGSNVVKNCIATGNAKAGFSTDASSDNNTYHHNVSYGNLFGIFFEGGTNNGSFGNKAYHNTCYNNTKSGIHVNNGHGWVDLRDNLLFLNGRDGSQDLWIQHDVSGTWVVHTGAIYKRTQVRWTMTAVAAPIGTVLTAAASLAAMVAGSWWYDDPADILYVWKADSSAVVAAFCTPITADTIDYNDYTPAGSLATGAKIARLNKPSGGTNYTSVPTMASVEGIEVNGIQLDPLYTNAAGGLFTLQFGSPAVDAGVAVAGVNDGYVGVAPDLGAYEQGVGGISTLSATPTLAGTGVVTFTGTAALRAANPALSGVGTLPITGTGTLAAAAPTVAGGGGLALTGTGALGASPTTAGTAALAFTATGALKSASSTTASSATLRMSGTGALASTPTLAGAGAETMTGTGALNATGKLAASGTQGLGTFQVLGGDVTADITEFDLVTGGKTITLTLTGTTWIAP